MPMLTSDDGVRLYYEETGSGTPILFVHEFAGDHRSWEPQVRHFSRRYRCIAYSARGYSPSDVPQDWEGYSQQRVRDDVRAVLDALGIERAHVVGLSMGAFATLHFGLTYPQRALSLVLAGGGSGAHPASYKAFQDDSRRNADFIRREGMERFAQTYGVGPTRIQFRNKDPRGFAEFQRYLAEHPAVGSANTMQGYQGRRPSLYDLTAEMGRLKLPTLIMTGDEDEPCLDACLMMKRAIPTSALVVLPRSGHAINLEEPALFNQFVDDFLHQVSTGRWSPRDERAKVASIYGPGGKP